MFDLFSQMAATPEAQADAYTWAAAFLGHVVLGLILTGTLSALLDGMDADGLNALRVTVKRNAVLVRL